MPEQGTCANDAQQEQDHRCTHREDTTDILKAKP